MKKMFLYLLVVDTAHDPVNNHEACYRVCIVGNSQSAAILHHQHLPWKKIKIMVKAVWGECEIKIRIPYLFELAPNLDLAPTLNKRPPKKWKKLISAHQRLSNNKKNKQKK